MSAKPITEHLSALKPLHAAIAAAVEPLSEERRDLDIRIRYEGCLRRISIWLREDAPHGA